MPKINLLLALIFFPFLSFGQSEIGLQVSISKHPKNFYFTSNTSTDNFDFQPIYAARFLFRKHFSSSDWFWETALSYTHTQFSEEIDFGPALIDPAIPPSGEYTRVLNFLGPGFGAGYSLRLNRSQRLNLPLGLRTMFGFASEFRDESGERYYSLFKGSSFFSGIYYGLYFRPAYEFRPSQKAGNPWRINLFANAEIMVSNYSLTKPIFILGGGIGINYRLKP